MEIIPSNKSAEARKKKPYKKKPKQQRIIARESIENLFRLAEEAFEKDRKLADRYVELAIKISNKYKERIPSKLKRRFCKNCHCFLMPGKNLRIRLQGSKIVYYCLNCKHFMRFPYVKEKREKKSKTNKIRN